MIRETVSIALAAAVFALALVPAVSFAGEWNQEKAIEEANKLVRYSKELKAGVAKDYEKGDKESARNAVLRSLMDIHHLAVALQSGLRSGQGASETEWIYKRIRQSVDNARADAARFPEVEKERATIDKANAALDELAKLYP